MLAIFMAIVRADHDPGCSKTIDMTVTPHMLQAEYLESKLALGVHSSPRLSWMTRGSDTPVLN